MITVIILVLWLLCNIISATLFLYIFILAIPAYLWKKDKRKQRKHRINNITFIMLWLFILWIIMKMIAI